MYSSPASSGRIVLSSTSWPQGPSTISVRQNGRWRTQYVENATAPPSPRQWLARPSPSTRVIVSSRNRRPVSTW